MNLRALPQNGQIGFSLAGATAVPLGADGMKPGVEVGSVVAGCELASWSASVPVAGLISSIAACGGRFGILALLFLTVGLASNAALVFMKNVIIPIMNARTNNKTLIINIQPMNVISPSIP